MDAPQVLISRSEIDATVRRLAGEIKRDLSGEKPLLVCVLKGSFVFAADLMRALNMPLEIQFVCASSYGGGTETSGKVKMRLGIKGPIAGRHVVVLEDIVDTGLTVNYIMKYLKRKKPSDVRLCALLDKPSRRRVPVSVDYRGFTVPDKFIVGYGIDWDEKFRYLPDICFIENGEKND